MKFGIVILVAVVLTAFTPTARADDPPRRATTLAHAAKGLTAAVAESEFAKMHALILKKGANMGPGDGWFKPSDVRYQWKWLAARFDADRDGKITTKELGGSPNLFVRLDRNRDGHIGADDLDWNDSSPFMRQMSPANMWLRMNDDDENRQLSKAEWDAMFKKLAQGKEYLNAEDVRALLNPPTPTGRSSGGGMPTKAILLKGLFSGELGSPCVGPGLNRPAPDFTLKSPDGVKTVALSKLIGPKPVVLIFGSFT